ncbi:NfeD family protein [Spirulina sp. CS-785/01]|uniref:NfeD family protein n=1 Tax=Spirulina sp. CS-785/01 TaxID=3021716 RepID=UPI00232E5B21|nr:NfeD family protein [Spirulina sp. CS-785/01]MDB9314234.1 NfeD family protein [Spirulina sp. CS-785/01]
MLQFFKANPSSRQSLNRWQGEAIVEQTIIPFQRGRVKFRGSWWFAQCLHDIALPPGERVNVVGRNSITLLVEPAQMYPRNTITDS